MREVTGLFADRSGSAGHPTGLDPDAALRSRRKRRRVEFGGVFGGVLLLTALLAFGLSRDPTIIASPLIGKPAPGFALRTLDGGGIVRLSDFHGQVVVVNFWKSTCAACYVEHPALLAAWNRYRDQGVVVVGVDFEDTIGGARRFAQSQGGDWPLVVDRDSRAVLAYGVTGPPETFFIGRDGRVAYKQIGPVDYGLMTDQITKLLEGGQS
jgi:cytochrome c biogenesis protein CcmG, thiol:disulfide interchange protein DsbE